MVAAEEEEAAVVLGDAAKDVDEVVMADAEADAILGVEVSALKLMESMSRFQTVILQLTNGRVSESVVAVLMLCSVARHWWDAEGSVTEEAAERVTEEEDAISQRCNQSQTRIHMFTLM